MNWLTANRLGNLAAVKALSRLGVDPARYPVDVDAAINSAGLPLMHQPMHGLFGVYMEANGNRGILVNSGLTSAARRQTAAHELGHHELNHRPDPARECAVEVGATAASRGKRAANIRAQGDIEMTAEAFAAWFLMPRKAVLAALADLGIVRPTGPAEVYQLSLLLGTSYRATCRHLVSTRVASRAVADVWARAQPARLKRDAASAGGYDLKSTLEVDVWSLMGSVAATVQAATGDLLVVEEPIATLADGLSSVSKVATAAGKSVFRCDLPLPPRILAGTDSSSAIQLSVRDRPRGIYLSDDRANNTPPTAEVL